MFACLSGIFAGRFGEIALNNQIEQKTAVGKNTRSCLKGNLSAATPEHPHKSSMPKKHTSTHSHSPAARKSWVQAQGLNRVCQGKYEELGKRTKSGAICDRTLGNPKREQVTKGLLEGGFQFEYVSR